MQKRSNFSLLAGGLLAIVVIAILGLFALRVRANTFDLITSNITATTTAVYMTAGTATTTYYYDSYAANVGDPNATDDAALLVQFTASSTSSKLNLGYEYAQGVPGVNCTTSPGACDWYADNTGTLSSTSPTFSATIQQTITWNFASSTQGGAATASDNNRILRTFSVQTPARYVRVFLSVPPGATNAAAWATFVARKQQP